MLSTAEAKFLGISATAVTTLQNLNPQATVIQSLSMFVCGYPMGYASFKEHLSAKKLEYFNHEKKAFCLPCCTGKSHNSEM